VTIAPWLSHEYARAFRAAASALGTSSRAGRRIRRVSCAPNNGSFDVVVLTRCRSSAFPLLTMTDVWTRPTGYYRRRVKSSSAYAHTGQVPHYRIAPSRKVSPGRQFTGKNPPRPAAARAGQIFTDKLLAGKTIFGRERVRQSYNVKTYGAGPAIKRRHINSVIISPQADFS